MVSARFVSERINPRHVFPTLPSSSERPPSAPLPQTPSSPQAGRGGFSLRVRSMNSTEKARYSAFFFLSFFGFGAFGRFCRIGFDGFCFTRLGKVDGA